MKTLLILCLIALSMSVAGMEVIDSNHVVNPPANETIVTFNGNIGSRDLKTGLEDEIVHDIEAAILDQIDKNPEMNYIRDLGKENFYWQIVDDGMAPEAGYYGVLLIIPQEEIRDHFYTELGGGLRMQAKYLTNFNTPWTNNGEIISFVVQKKDLQIVHVDNWRFKYDPLEEGADAYYSPLKIHVQQDEVSQKVVVKHFVDKEFRGTYAQEGEFNLKLPKGRVSAIAFYVEGNLEGVLCFNMANVRYPCAMDYVTSVSFGEGSAEEKIMYAEPCCCEKYSLIFLEEESFEDLSAIYHWVQNSIIKPEVNVSGSEVLEEESEIIR